MKSWAQQTIFFSPSKVALKCMEQNLDNYNEPRFNEIIVITNKSRRANIKCTSV